MKATGIIRRIDDLGRIVIPKEIRRILHIHEGDPLELYTDSEGIIFKKYSVLEDWKENARMYAKTLWQHFGETVLICDTDRIIATSPDFKVATDMLVANEVSEQIRSGKEFFTAEIESDDGITSATAENIALMRKVQIVVPVREGKEICGAVIVLFGSSPSANAEPLRSATWMIADILSNAVGA